MYENILLPVDGSEGAARVLPHASELAHRTDARVCLLYVADTTRDSVTVVEDRVVDALAQEGHDVLAEAGETLDTLGVEYDTDVVQGNPAPTIVEYAEEYDHDLIVMPTHGREGLSRLLLGSVTEKVVRLSSVPVLTVRMQPDEKLTFPYECVLLPTDGSAVATRAAEHGLALAALLDATVHVLSVVDDSVFDLGGQSAEGDHGNEQAAADAVADVAAAAEERGLTSVETHVEHGTPADGILDAVESIDVDAVVMGTTGRRGTERILLGSVAETVVRSAPVPVITVRKPE